MSKLLLSLGTAVLAAPLIFAQGQPGTGHGAQTPRADQSGQVQPNNGTNSQSNTQTDQDTKTSRKGRTQRRHHKKSKTTRKTINRIRILPVVQVRTSKKNP